MVQGRDISRIFEDARPGFSAGMNRHRVILAIHVKWSVIGRLHSPARFMRQREHRKACRSSIANPPVRQRSVLGVAQTF